jgi:hypothetical protein
VSEKTINLSEYIAENFGANASYVEGLLNRFQSDPIWLMNRGARFSVIY